MSQSRSILLVLALSALTLAVTAVNNPLILIPGEEMPTPSGSIFFHELLCLTLSPLQGLLGPCWRRS